MAGLEPGPGGTLKLAFWIFSIKLPIRLTFPEQFLQGEGVPSEGLMLQGDLNVCA